jgi:hypothetical protein
MKPPVLQNPHAPVSGWYSVIANLVFPSPRRRHSGASHIDSPVLSHLRVVAGRWTSRKEQGRIQATTTKIWTLTEFTIK